MLNFSTMNLRLIKCLFISITVLFLVSSCASNKDVLYLQDIQLGKTQIENNYMTVFQSDDLLVINVSSPDVKGAIPFNLPISSVNSNVAFAGGIQKQVTYLVRKDGSIEFPILGKVQLAGLTMLEAIELLQSMLKDYIKDPIVNIEWANYKFTVLGDVFRPGTYKVINERTTIFEAIGMAGDLNITGVRKEIILIREINNERTVFKFDITSKDILDSEAYFIKQNDVIVVKPNRAQINSSIYNRNVPLYVSVASVLISLIAVLSRL